MSNLLQLKFLAFSGYLLISAFLVARLWIYSSAFFSVQLLGERGCPQPIASGDLAGSFSGRGSTQDETHVPQGHIGYHQINQRLTS